MDKSTESKRQRGRPEGSTSRLSREAREKAQATGLLPHEILLSFARGEPQKVYEPTAAGKVIERLVPVSLEERRAAAVAAAPYYAPKISQVHMIGNLSDDDLTSLIGEFATQAGLGPLVGGAGEADEVEAGTRGEPRSDSGSTGGRRRVDV